MPDIENNSGPATSTVTLNRPIKREGGDVTQITFREPNSGELRGLKVADVMQGEATAIITLIPRISAPFIAQQEAEKLGAADFAEIAGTILGFFMSPAQKEMVRQMTEGSPSTH